MHASAISGKPEQQGVQEAFDGTAIAIALGGSALPSNKRFAISTYWGNFRGQNALSLAAQMRINDVVVLNAGVARGLQHQGIGTRVGATFAWWAARGEPRAMTFAE